MRVEYKKDLGVSLLSIIYENSECCFCLDGITERDLHEGLEYTGYKSKIYEKYTPDKPLDGKNVMETLGILGGAVDWVCYNYSREKDTPYLSIQMQHPDIMKNRFGVFHSQLMLRFLQYMPKRKRGMEKIFKLIETASEKLISVEKIPEKMDGADRVYYYRTIDAIERRGARSAVYYYRRKIGFTQAELAERIGVSDRQMQRYETEDLALANAPLAVLEKTAYILGVGVEDLVLNGELVRKL